MSQLTTWDIPIGGIIITDNREYKYIGVKRERRPRIGVKPIQYFISQDADKKQICFLYGLPVELIDGFYYIKK